MATVLFCPVTFNLAETTRMIEVAHALNPRHRAVFMGYEDDFASLISQAGFDFRPRQPALTAAQRAQVIAFDQGRSPRNPFTMQLVAARLDPPAGRADPPSRSGRAGRSHPAASIKLSRPRCVGRTPEFRWRHVPSPRSPGPPVSTLRTAASLLEADINLLTVMPEELAGYTLPGNFRRVGPIFAHLDAPLPALVTELAQDRTPLVYLGLGSSASRTLALAAARRLGELPVNVVAPIRHYMHDGDTCPPTSTSWTCSQRTGSAAWSTLQ